MPRRKGIPAYCEHRATGQARCIVDGRSVYLGAFGSDESKRKYRELVKRVTADRVKEEMRRAVEVFTDITVAELVPRYVLHVEGYYVKNGEPTTQVLLVKRDPGCA